MEMGNIYYAYEEIEKGENARVISGFERIVGGRLHCADSVENILDANDVGKRRRRRMFGRILFRERRIRGCREQTRSEGRADGGDGGYTEGEGSRDWMLAM